MYHKQLIIEYTFPYTYTRLIFSAQTYFLKEVWDKMFDLNFIH